MISAIQWVSQLIGVAGGDDVFPELAVQRMGRDRVIADALEPARRAPDVIFGSWCGKKFRPEHGGGAQPAGPRCPRCATAGCTRSSPATSCSPARRR
jgi:hypothetical protein